MEEYTYTLVVNVLANMERMRSFVERTTHELFPLYYQIEVPDGYRTSENHTLEDLSPHTTRIPTKDGLQETLLILLCDVERSLYILDPLDRLELVMTLDESLHKRKDEEIKVPEHLVCKIESMCKYLNYGTI